MTAKFEENGLVLVDFVLRNIQFSPEYAASVEQKQIAEQLAQQAEFIVQQREQEAQQAREVAAGQADAVEINAQGTANALVIQAKAEAEARLLKAEAEAQALELIAAALRDNPEVLTFEYISKLAPGIRVMLLPSNNPFLLPLPEFEETEVVIPPLVP
jgi:regulator of protease activity HflC (stomatin/prohibitin superfamily)